MVEYLQSKTIFILFIKKFLIKNLDKDHSNILIEVAKLLDKKKTSIKVLKHWQKFKVYKLSLAQYLEEGKIELFYQKIKLSIEILLIMLLWWLISKT